MSTTAAATATVAGAAARAAAREWAGLRAAEWAVFAVVSVANLVPLWAFRYFPGQDTPNHLYAVEVTRALVDGSAPPAMVAAFAPALALKSNVLFHALMLGLCRLGLSLDVAHRLVLSAYAVALPLAGLACVRTAAPRNAPLALLLLPLVWSWFALQGLYNYLLSLPPALVWLGLVARDGGRPGWHAGEGVLVSSLLVYLAHVVTFGALLIVTAVRVLWPDDGTRRGLRARAAAAWPLAFALAPAVALAAAGFPGLWGARAPLEPTVSRLESYGPPEAAGAFVVELAMRYHVWELLLLGPPLVALLAIPLGAARRRFTEGPARWPLAAALALAVLYFAMPHIALGSDASPRLRPLIPFVLLCYGGVALGPRARRAVVALALVTGVFGGAALARDAARVGRELDDLTSGIPFVRPGSRLYPMVFDPRGESLLVRPYLHAWGYYGVARRVVTPFAFAWHETRFPYRYRELPLHGWDSAFPSDGEDEPYALVQGRLCRAQRRFAPSLSCDDVRAATEARLAMLGTAYDYVLTWAAPADFTRLLRDRGYRLVHGQGQLALYQPPVTRGGRP